MSASSDITTNSDKLDAFIDPESVLSVARSYFGKPEAKVEFLRADSDLVWCRADAADSVYALIIMSSASSSRVDERLRREFKLLNGLSCGAVVHPLALNRDHGRVALVLEYPGGVALDAFISDHEKNPADLSSLLSIACETACAIHQVHECNIIHGDLKPANCFLASSGQVKLTGFGLAGQLIRDERGPRPVEVIAGTLPYMSPEQTGRMSRSLDTRSDLYSLGVLLYELFSGTLPFTAGDAIEWAHRHLASKPVRPSERNERLPRQLDAIILKLLAKNPDDRYQTAKGVENDLRRCLAEWTATQQLERFPPGRSDALSAALTSGKLYGRDDALQTLLNAADRVITDGESELVLVAGPAGIGKSSLVDEVFRTLAGRNILFAAGKFDQQKRDIPYATIAQAFSSLMRQLLSMSETELTPWRAELASALHPNAQLIVDLVPELAYVIGPQPAAAPADFASAQVRFHLVFREFLKVFATAKHPLILFVDDLQWLDAATLELMRRVISDPAVRHVLLIGAARNDDLSEPMALQEMLESLRKTRGRVPEIALRELAESEVVRLLANTLSSRRARVAALAKLVREKTGGNPFFIIQFVRELASDGSLFFEPKTSRWMWKISRIRAKGMTDNVAQLLTTRLDRLPEGTRAALGTLSCLGNSTDEQTSALILGWSAEKLRTALRPAIDLGLLSLSGDKISFAHDHVQTAAYASVDAADRPSIHLKIGKLLLASTSTRSLEEKVFEIASQFDKGLSAVRSPDELEVANLYLAAGRRAKAASAYSSARAYFEKGRSLLGDDHWDDHYNLFFQLELNQAECEIVTEQLELAEGRLEKLLSRARDFSDQAEAVCLAVLLYFTTGRSDRAVEIGTNFLRGTLVDWPSSATAADVQREFELMHERLANVPIASLVDLPPTADPFIISTMSVLMEVFPAAYAVDRHLMELILLRMTNLSLEHGNCESSSVAYSALNMALGAQFGDYATAYAFGELARQLVDRNHSGRYRARVYSLFTGFATPWIKPFSYSAPIMAEAFRLSCSTGDLAFAAYNTRNRLTHEFMAGLPLRHVQREAEEAVAFASKVQLGLPPESFFGQLQLVRKIRGLGKGGIPDEDDWAMEDPDPPPGVAMMVSYHWVFRLIQHYLMEDFAAAYAAAVRVEPQRWAMRSSVEEAEYDFYAGLTSAVLADRDAASQRQDHLNTLRRSRQRMAVWAGNCPENFASREAVLAAELARLEGSDAKAQSLYEVAVKRAWSDGFVQVEAIAAELAGRFYETKELQTAADAYLKRARDCFFRWGCAAKVQLLDCRYDHLGERQSAQSPGTIEMPVASLDVEAVGRASKVLSSEMVLGRLVEKLMRLAVQHAGAERGALLLLDGGELLIEAMAVTKRGAVEVSLDRRRATPSELPRTVLQYVLRTKIAAILNDISPGALDPSDEYLQRARPRSLLCIPMFNASEVIGLLYVENGLAADVFSRDRIAALDFLASQAGIWLENARLYSDLQRSEAWLSEAQRLSQTGSFYWQDELDPFQCSEEIYRICGFEMQTPITLQRLKSRFHPADQHQIEELFDSALTSGTDTDHQLRLLMDDGSIKFVRLVTRSDKDRKGLPRRLCSLQDITATQAAQTALGKVHSELAHVSRTATLGVLTASITHEVSQPLLAIIANAETCQLMLGADPPNIEGAQRMTHRCLRDGQRAGDTIKRLRSLFGSKTLTIEPIDVNHVLREVLALASNELQVNSVVVKSEFAQRLPRASGDRVQVQQVVLNLLLNAIDAMRETPPSDRELSLTTRFSGNGLIQVDVRDRGPGVQADTAERLFDAFYTTKERGMGVGLPVSRAIVESLGGQLWATSNSDRGATFSFTLQQESGNSMEPDKSSERTPGSSRALGK